ncbi:hypothetical protein ACKUSY_01910 [Myroides odoratus]
MKNLQYFLLLCVGLNVFFVYGQIGINTPLPHPSAALDIHAPNQGFLPPRVELKGKDDQTTINKPAEGLLIYNLANSGVLDNKVVSGYYYWNGKNWVMLSSEDQFWGVNGNYGTNAQVNFIGTQDNQDLVFKRNGVQAGLLSSAQTFNTSFGVGSYKGTPLGSYSGRWNTAIGYNSLNGNNAVVSGHDNTAVGANSLTRNTTGRNNTAIGSESLKINTLGNDNTAIGFQSLIENIGSHNTAVGGIALGSNDLGEKNTAVGYIALNQNISGSYNTAIGYRSGVNSGMLENTSALGYDAKISTSNTIRLGNKSITSIFGQVPFSSASDQRYFYAATPLSLGLNLLNKLKPLEYTRNSTNPTSEKEWGITAQDIQDALRTLNYSNAGLIDSERTNEQMLLLRYTDLIAPIIKAIQELSNENKELKRRIEILEGIR